MISGRMAWVWRDISPFLMTRYTVTRRVLTLPFSKDIITMYPTDETLKEKIEVDVMKEEEKPKQKVYHRESQIEKFNRRYNLK